MTSRSETIRVRRSETAVVRDFRSLLTDLIEFSRSDQDEKGKKLKELLTGSNVDSILDLLDDTIFLTSHDRSRSRAIKDLSDLAEHFELIANDSLQVAVTLSSEIFSKLFIETPLGSNSFSVAPRIDALLNSIKPISKRFRDCERTLRNSQGDLDESFINEFSNVIDRTLDTLDLPVSVEEPSKFFPQGHELTLFLETIKLEINRLKVATTDEERSASENLLFAAITSPIDNYAVTTATPALAIIGQLRKIEEAEEAAYIPEVPQPRPVVLADIPPVVIIPPEGNPPSV